MDALTELARVCDETYLEWTPPGWVLPLAPPHWADRYLEDDAWALLGWDGDALVCSVAFRSHSESVAHVGLVFVHPSRWRQGIAARLMGLAEAEMRARGYEREQLWTPNGAPGRAVLPRPGLAAGRAPRVAPVGGAGDGRLREGALVRVLLGAFGDPGHAFPVIALGSELVARGHDGGDRDLAAVAGALRGGGHGVRGGAGVPGLSRRVSVPLKPYEAAVRARGDARASSSARSRRTWWSPTSSPARRLWRRSSRACRWRPSSRTCTRTSRPGCRRSRSARGGRARALGARLWSVAGPGGGGRARAGADGVQRRAGAARAAAAAVRAHGPLPLA